MQIGEVEISRKVEFDAGHRIPDHKSKCRNMHGHRYVLEATVRGKPCEQDGASDRGMVTDFGDLKQMMMDLVHEPWDHAFLVYKGDTEVLDALTNLFTGHKHVVLDYVPTAELLAWDVFGRLDEELTRKRSTFTLVRVRLYETPNCWADVVR